MATNRRQQIQLSPDEQAAFFRERKKAALATIDKDGFPHVVAMNYFGAGQRAEARGAQDRPGEGGELGPPQARRTILTHYREAARARCATTPRLASSASTSPARNRCAASCRLNAESMWQRVRPRVNT